MTLGAGLRNSENFTKLKNPLQNEIYTFYCQGKLHQIHVPLIYTKLIFEVLCLPF